MTTSVCLKLLEGDGLEAVIDGAAMVEKEPPAVHAPEEKRPALSLEELEAKQGKRRILYICIAT